MASKNTSSGIGLSGLLLVVFVVLKLTKNIDWSWMWVISPLWIPLVLAFSLFIIILFVIILLLIFGFTPEDLKNKFQKYRK
jgi:hypothetical protein